MKRRLNAILICLNFIIEAVANERWGSGKMASGGLFNPFSNKFERQRIDIIECLINSPYECFFAFCWNGRDWQSASAFYRDTRSGLLLIANKRF